MEPWLTRYRCSFSRSDGTFGYAYVYEADRTFNAYIDDEALGRFGDLQSAIDAVSSKEPDVPGSATDTRWSNAVIIEGIVRPV